MPGDILKALLLNKHAFPPRLCRQLVVSGRVEVWEVVFQWRRCLSCQIPQQLLPSMARQMLPNDSFKGQLCSCLAPAHTAWMAPHRLPNCVLLPELGIHSPHSQVPFSAPSPITSLNFPTFQPRWTTHHPERCPMFSFLCAFLFSISYFWNALPSSLTILILLTHSFKKSFMSPPTSMISFPSAVSRIHFLPNSLPKRTLQNPLQMDDLI